MGARGTPARRATGVLAALGAAAVLAPTASATAPNTRITAGPAGFIATRSATFRFASTAGATFQCRLDGRAWAACASPTTYRRLIQGRHTFRVRAVKNGVHDPTPATRTFTIDTVKPNTTIVGGPNGSTGDQTPSFTFSASEKATFQCRLGEAAFAPCTSPFTPASPLADADYEFQVRARDRAGNIDASPATRAFIVVTPVSNDLATAQAAAAYYFPDSLDVDVVPDCASQVTLDCNDGVPRAPGAQLRIATTRTVQAAGADAYGASFTQNVQALAPIEFSFQSAVCWVSLGSANGNANTWSVGVTLSFVPDDTGAWRIETDYPTVAGVEYTDYALSGGVDCMGGLFTADFISDLYAVVVFSRTGVSLCAAPGPAYLGPCPQP